jgi:parvulin-like peptidyl-prolyl isomerase
MIARPALRPALVAFAALTVAVGITAGCGGGGSSGSLSSGVVANVDGDKITQSQLDEVIAQAQDRLKAQGQTIPAAGSAEYQAFQQNALQYLVQRAQFQQQADKLGVKVTDKQVDERLGRVKKQYFGGSDEKYQAALKKQGITDAQVRDELRATLVSEAVFQKVGDAAKVTNADVDAYYKAHPELYTQKPSRAVRHILVRSKALANDIYAKLQNGGDFAALAKKYSLDSSKDVGGKLTDRQGDFVPQFEKVAFALKVNEISKPVKSRFGWHVIQALEPITPGTTTPIAKVRKTIRETLMGQNRSEAVTTWLADLKKEYAKKITYAKGFAPPATQPTTSTTPTN